MEEGVIMMTILDCLKQDAIDLGCDPNTLRIWHRNNYNLTAYAINVITGEEEITSGWICHDGDINVEPRHIPPRKINIKSQ
jgi:hypothetical protein